MKIRNISYVLIVVMLLTLLGGCKEKEEPVEKKPVSYDSLMKEWKGTADSDTLTCWYTSDADKTWLEGAAAEFEKQYGAKVSLVYYDGINFFSDLNQANQNGKGPDVYLMGNDQLEFARNSGMVEENTRFDEGFWKKYPETAKNAVTFQGKQYGYPIYFDTYCLVYDANLLENAPASIDDILTFLDAYEDTGSTKAVFRWDVADAYINTMFLASYANLFGKNGDEAESFKINDEKSVAAMEYFQSLSAYLWMNKKNISHDTIMNRIKDGTLVLGLCKSDILPTLYEMNSATENTEEKQEGEEEDTKEKTNYQISYVPSLTAEISSTTFSTTYSAFVNPYAKDSARGNQFALFLSYAYADKQYAGNGKLPVINQKDKFDSMQSIIYAQYLNSKPVPKVMVLGDYLTESSITFDAIWEGENAKECLDKLQERMEQKIK